MQLHKEIYVSRWLFSMLTQKSLVVNILKIKKICSVAANSVTFKVTLMKRGSAYKKAGTKLVKIINPGSCSPI